MPTEQDLDEIWDELQMFKSSRMWRMLVDYMMHLHGEAAETALNADVATPKGVNEVLVARGRAEAIKQIVNFDEFIPTLAKLKKEKTNAN